MQMIYFIAALFMTAQTTGCAKKKDFVQDQSIQHTEFNIVHLEVGGEVVFDSTKMTHSNLSIYPNQLMFTVMDDEGQNITITFAGKDISQRKPEALTFDSPGLFHGFSNAQDVFFIAFGKLASDREPGQLKYERHLPQLIMQGELKVISWTDSVFEFSFEGKLGEENQVNTPESWLPFSGSIKAASYQQYNE
ncbi:hypothetical protein MM213_03145 [Belliella sp. R4-6]|uniref:Uncharacterized protein n=1 Tax=Belliella alkalica TaxID=1730871 RepID=A0ABS9V7S2_9BACT|nr:hypothetical protein [Belliella alkalica]MCH7412467.1 hypothetical protein [Belliella alkalica]